MLNAAVHSVKKAANIITRGSRVPQDHHPRASSRPDGAPPPSPRGADGPEDEDGDARRSAAADGHPALFVRGGLLRAADRPARAPTARAAPDGRRRPSGCSSARGRRAARVRRMAGQEQEVQAGRQAALRAREIVGLLIRNA